MPTLMELRPTIRQAFEDVSDETFSEEWKKLIECLREAGAQGMSIDVDGAAAVWGQAKALPTWKKLDQTLARRVWEGMEQKQGPCSHPKTVTVFRHIIVTFSSC
jgi:hypothetical protein